MYILNVSFLITVTQVPVENQQVIKMPLPHLALRSQVITMVPREHRVVIMVLTIQQHIMASKTAVHIPNNHRMTVTITIGSTTPVIAVMANGVATPIIIENPSLDYDMKYTNQ